MTRTVGVVFGLSILFTVIAEFRRNRFVLFSPFLKSSFISSWRDGRLVLAFSKRSNRLKHLLQTNGLLDENTLKSISTAHSIKCAMSTELLPNTLILAWGINGKLHRKQLFPTIFFGVSSIHEARIWNLFPLSNKKRGKINHPLGGLFYHSLWLAFHWTITKRRLALRWSPRALWLIFLNKG